MIPTKFGALNVAIWRSAEVPWRSRLGSEQQWANSSCPERAAVDATEPQETQLLLDPRSSTSYLYIASHRAFPREGLSLAGVVEGRAREYVSKAALPASTTWRTNANNIIRKSTSRLTYFSLGECFVPMFTRCLVRTSIFGLVVLRYSLCIGN